jgi:hypothetical protein
MRTWLVDIGIIVQQRLYGPQDRVGRLRRAPLLAGLAAPRSEDAQAN